jgi:hypothetical protein
VRRSSRARPHRRPESPGLTSPNQPLDLSLAEPVRGMLGVMANKGQGSWNGRGKRAVPKAATPKVGASRRAKTGNGGNFKMPKTSKSK